MRNISLGEKIRVIRKNLNLNQLELANKLGFKSATAISKFEDNSRNPSKNNLIEIAKMGNISLDELLTGEYKENETGAERPIIKDTEGPYGATALAREKINIDEAQGKAFRVLNAGNALSVALYMNIQQFAAALDTAQEMKVCKDQLKDMQVQINKLQEQVDRLTAVPATSGAPTGSLDKKAI